MSKFCVNCGAELKEGADICISCGKVIKKEVVRNENESPKSRLVAFLLCSFLGALGVHRFYVGKVGTGILWLFTFGLFGIGSFIDWILILCGTFKDKDNLLLTNWNN